MPTSSSSSQTSSRESRSPPNENEHPLHSGSSQSSVPDDLTGVLTRQAEHFHSLGITTPVTVMLGGRSLTQSPPPARPSTPISQVLETSELFQDNPTRLHTSLPLSSDHLVRRQNSPVQSARQPRRPPRPFLRISTQVDRVHRPRASTPAFLPGASQPNDPIQRPDGEGLLIRQPRLPPVATPTAASLHAALTNNNSRFFIRLQARKTELLSRLQPNCPRISEFCEAVCSCRHALDSIDRWTSGVRVPNYIETGPQPVNVPSAEHAHSWVFSVNGVRRAAEILKDIMRAEMPVTVKDGLEEVEEILDGIQSALTEEMALYNQRTGRKGYSRWEVCFDRSEDERKRWVNGGYQDVLAKRENMQLERRDSTATVALSHILTVELDQTLQRDENIAPEQTPGRERAAASVANAVGMMNRRLSAERRESTAPQSPPRSVPAADPNAQQLSQQREAQRRMRRAQTTLAEARTRHAREAASILRSPRSPTSQFCFDHLNAEYRQSTAGRALQAGESLPRSARGLTQPRFRRRNAISWPRERSVTRASPTSAPNQDAVNEQTYGAAHFVPLPVPDTEAELGASEDVERGDERDVFDAHLDRAFAQPTAILSNMRLEIQELFQGDSAIEQAPAPLSNEELEARELERMEAEQWEQAVDRSTTDRLAVRPRARSAREIARERVRRRRVAMPRGLESAPLETFEEPSDFEHSTLFEP